MTYRCNGNDDINDDDDDDDVTLTLIASGIDDYARSSLTRWNNEDFDARLFAHERCEHRHR